VCVSTERHPPNGDKMRETYLVTLDVRPMQCVGEELCYCALSAAGRACHQPDVVFLRRRDAGDHGAIGADAIGK